MFMHTKARPKLKPNPLSLLLAGAVLAWTNSLAADCGVLHLQRTRNSDANVFNNHCPDPTELSLESILELPAGGRVWLETAATNDVATNFLLICQNNSLFPLKIKVASPFSPWIEPISTRCDSWVDRRLICSKTGSQSPALLCAIAQRPSFSAVREIRLKTSVTMRSIRSQSAIQTADELDKWAEFVKPGIALCRKIDNTQQPIALSWTITPSGKVSNAKTVETFIDNEFSACALEALENADFPSVANELSLTYKF